MARKIRNEDLLPLVLSGMSQIEISRQLNVTPASVCRRVNAPDFTTQLQEHRKRILDATVTNLTAHSQKAVECLLKLLDSPNDFVRFNAASKILQLTQDYSLQADLIRDVEEIKRMQESKSSEW